MENQKLLKFIEAKQKYADEGFKFSFVFETSYLSELAENYAKRRIKIEKMLDNEEPRPEDVGKFLMIAHVQKKFDETLKGVKIIHIGTDAGFSREEIALVAMQDTNEKLAVQKQSFLEAMKKILGNKEMIPDKTVVILTTEAHHTMEAGGRQFEPFENKTPHKEKQREKVSKRKGQKSITSFFKSVKNEPIKLKPKTSSRYKVEEIAQSLRGDEVKILWFPKKHFELNPSNYVSVILLDEISKYIENNQEVDLLHACESSIDNLPNAVWEYAVSWEKACEEFYQKLKENAAAVKAEEENVPVYVPIKTEPELVINNPQ